MSLKCQIECAASCLRQQFLCIPSLCTDIVSGRDLLTASGISLHVALGGWIVSTESQRIVPFINTDREWPEAVEDCAESLRCIFAVDDATASVCQCSELVA